MTDVPTNDQHGVLTQFTAPTPFETETAIDSSSDDETVEETLNISKCERFLLNNKQNEKVCLLCMLMGSPYEANLKAFPYSD